VCCSQHCDKLTSDPLGVLKYRTKWWSFQGALKVKQLNPNSMYLFSIHNIPYQNEVCPLPIKLPILEETIADIGNFKTDAMGNASVPFDSSDIKHCWFYYDVQPRLKVLGGDYKYVLCKCLNHAKFRITSIKLLIIWSILILLDVVLLFVVVKKKRKKATSFKLTE
jgi:hypothetical protein